MAARREKRPTSVDAEGHLDLRALDLRAGEATSFTFEVPPSHVILGGSTYEVIADDGTASLDVSHAYTGWHLHVRLAGSLHGPCWRCLEAAVVPLRADTTDFSRFDRPVGEAFDEDLDSEYINQDGLDALSMARDALLDGVPNPILCRADCAGLCPTCGVSLNAGPCGCAPSGTDSRWDALRDIAARLEQTEE